MTAPQAEIIQLGIGDSIPIGQVLTNLILIGLLTDPNNPNLFAATMQAYQRQAVLTVPVLQGVKGDPGEPSFALQWQNDGKTDPSQLPTDLGDTVADLGKFWVFGVQDELGNTVATTMYVWWGTVIGWRQLPVGAPGPPGAYPVITPHIVLEVPGSGHGPSGVDSWIHVDGSIANPQFTFHVAAPQGVAGPSAALGSCPDVDFSTPPQPGDTLTCTARLTPGAPTALGIVTAGTGGTLAAGPYFYKVTATMTNGETLGSNEVTTGTLTGTTNKATLSWTAPSGGGATGYRIYRGTVIGAENVLAGIVTDGATTTFVDTGASTTPATIPSIGVFAGRNIWVPQAPLLRLPGIFTIPEAAFTAAFSIGGAMHPICAFDMPKRADGPWKPWITGQLKVLGASISFTPLLVGAEVRLGDPTTGQIVARGYGNSLGSVTFIPHTSDATDTTTAMTPTNGVGRVPANHTGTQGTLYVNLINMGMAGVYDFNPTDAQMGALSVPM